MKKLNTIKRQLFGTAITFLIFAMLLLAGRVENRVSGFTESGKKATNTAYFEENRGQLDSRVKYFSRGSASEMFLTATEAVYVVRSKTKPKADETDRVSEVSESNEKAVAVYMRLAGANAAANFAPTEALEHKTNYFRGRDSSKWQTDVPNFGRVTAEQIYDGIDMVWHGKGNGALPYDFVVRPFADPNLIELEIAGADEVLIDADGSLVIKTAAGEMRQPKPHTFQESDGGKSEVESGFVLTESDTTQGAKIYTVKFALGEYDNSKTLTFGESDNSSVALGLSDLMYSTFLGGAAVDTPTAIAVDGAGRTFVVGYTSSTDFPTAPGSFDPTQNGNEDAFITKLNADGSGLVYSTFLGGADGDGASDIAIDIAGNAFVTGGSGSSDFPTTAGAFDTTSGGDSDVFVTKLNASGSGLIYSTFLGGTNTDTGSGIAVDGSGNVFVTGIAGSPNFPTTAGAFDTVWNGGSGFLPSDGFITKLNASGSALVYSTFVGGDNLDNGNQIALDNTGNAFVMGDTRGDFPVTVGAFDTSSNGDEDSFVLKLNPSGSALIYSTYLGGTDADYSGGIAVDGTGNVFVTGRTDSSNFPTTAGAFDTTFNGGGFTQSDGFITKLNASGSALVYSTFVGGATGVDSGSDIVIDNAGIAVVLGGTESTDFPTTADAFDTTLNGGTDVFVAKLNASGSALSYSTFFGGTSSDDSPFRGIAIDNADNVYITGRTLSSDFPTTTGAFDTTYSGTEDVFVAKFGNNPLGPVLGVYSPTTLVLSDNIVITPSFAPLNTLRLTASSSTNFIGELTADPVTGVVRVTNAAHANIAPGTYPVTVKAFGGGLAPPTATATFNLTVLNPLTCSSALFNPPVTHGTGGTFSPVIGDFNGDGNQDIAINNTLGINNVSILIGDGNGSFAPAVDYPAGGFLTIDDFDGDGNQDIATVKQGGSPSIAILWGNGDGTFAVGSDVPTNGLGSRALAVGDFNEDGNRDLAVANFTSNNVSIMIGSGTGAFTAPVLYIVPFQTQPNWIVVGDFNNDGHHDVMTAYNQSRAIGVFNGNGTGTFSAPVITSLGAANSNPRSLVIGDFDLDGDQDVALVANDSANSVLILLGNGDSTFAAPLNHALLAIRGIALGDFNGDGIQDIAVSRSGTPTTLRILQGTGTGLFNLSTTQFPAGGAAGTIASGDFNGDFRQDIIITTSSGPGINLLQGTCTVTAANVSVSGRVTTLTGEGIRNARLVLTSPDGTYRTARTSTFGYYAFEEVEVGQTYVLEIASKRYTFANPTRVINLQEQLTGVDFIAEPQ